MRRFSVSEEMLPIDPVGLSTAPLKSEMTLRYEAGVDLSQAWGVAGQTRSSLSVGLVGKRIRVVGPPESALFELLETMRIGRALADRSAKEQERRAVALGSPVVGEFPGHAWPASSSPPDEELTSSDSCTPTCGLHIHVAVDSPEEGVQVLDRVRLWLPVLLALSANSPFWHERPTQSSSRRYLSRFQFSSPRLTDVFGSAEEYERRMRHLTHPAAARWSTATELDAQLSPTRETLDILLTDVCMDAAHAAVLAAIARSLVEFMSRQWREGVPPVPAPVADVSAASWFSAMNGLRGLLLSPTSGRLCSAREAVMELLSLVEPVLREYGEDDYVETVIGDLLRHGNGSGRQRRAYAQRHDLQDVVRVALRGTHDPTHAVGIPGAILAETWALTNVEHAPRMATSE